MKKSILFSILFIASLCACNSVSNKNDNDETGKDKSVSKSKSKQLNISILLDLSDRIDSVSNPSQPQHYLRDISIIKSIAKYFKDDMDKHGAFQSKERIKVFFSPNPVDPLINDLSRQLDIDLSKMDIKQKKDIYDAIEKTFEEVALKIYKLAMLDGQMKGYHGADIWRFFKRDIKDYCIMEDSIYRNILVILTDGYIYHKDSYFRNKNQTTYLTPTFIKNEGLRNSNGLQRMKENNYGLIVERQDLSNLEVLVLEITPALNNINDDDIIHSYISDWFTKMNLKGFKIYNTDIPDNTKIHITDFISHN